MRRLLTLALIGLLAGSASAALDGSNAYDDGTTTWAGTTSMANSNLSADIGWVVNAPVGGLFEYKYQVDCTGTEVLEKFSVGMLDSNEAQNIGSAAGDGSVAPLSASFAGIAPNLQSADWTFAGMNQGDLSYELTYWSVNAPIMGIGSIHNGVLAGGLVPSPSDEIPEPATMSLLAIGGLALIRRRR